LTAFITATLTSIWLLLGDPMEPAAFDARGEAACSAVDCASAHGAADAVGHDARAHEVHVGQEHKKEDKDDPMRGLVSELGAGIDHAGCRTSRGPPPRSVSFLVGRDPRAANAPRGPPVG